METVKSPYSIDITRITPDLLFQREYSEHYIYEFGLPEFASACERFRLSHVLTMQLFDFWLREKVIKRHVEENGIFIEVKYKINHKNLLKSIKRQSIINNEPFCIDRRIINAIRRGR